MKQFFRPLKEINKTLLIVHFMSYILFFSMTSLNATQSSQELKNEIKNLEKKLKAQKSFAVEFQQEFYSLLRHKVTESSGVLEVKPPMSFRWEIISPKAELYVKNPNEFWKFSSSLKHAQKIDPKHSEMKFLDLFLKPDSISQSFSISRWDEEEAKLLKQNRSLTDVKSDLPPILTPEQMKSFLLLKLIPRGDKQQKTLYAVVDKEKGHLLELRVVQINGNRSRLVFKNYKKDFLPDSRFVFSPPSGTVIDTYK